MTTTQQELLQSQTSAEKTNGNNPNSNWSREQIEKTPFWVIGNEEQGYNLIMGKWKLTIEPFKTKNELKKWMNSNHWNIILSMIICATEDMKKINNDTNKPI